MSDSTKIKTLSSWSDFVDHLSKDNKSGQFIYRGQSNPSWSLASPFERWLLRSLDLMGHYPYISADPNAAADHGREYYQERRGSALQDFIDLSNGCFPIEVDKLKEFEQWVVGRHYGLITPILDWSSSPYVAAWFAFRDIVLERWDETKPIQLGGHVSIWELNLGEIEATEKIPDLIVHEDPQIPELGRSSAQKSYYTELNNYKVFELDGYLTKNGVQDCLKQLLLPINAISQAIKELSKMDIHCRTMFDDLAGAAEEANWRAFSGGLYKGFSFSEMEDGVY